jgi:protease PrsW
MNPRRDISYRQLALTLYERSGVKSELARITHGSPLREWRLGVVAAIVLPLGLILLLLSSNRIRQGTPYWLHVVALGITGIAAYPAQHLLRRLDTTEREPWWLRSGAKWYGSALSLGVAAVLNRTAASVLTILFGSTFAAGLQLAVLDPLAAEAAKGVALLLLVWLLCNELDGVRDGIVYGAYVGLGYLVAVTMVTLARAYLATGALAALNIVLWRFVFLGLNEHTLWSAIFGAAVGLALQTDRRWLSIAAPLAGFLLALLADILHQAMVIGFFGGTLGWFGYLPTSFARFGAIPPGVVWLAAAFSTLAFQFPFYLLLLVALLWSGRWERQLLERQLRSEVGTPSLTADEYAALLAGHELYQPTLSGWLAAYREGRLTQELIIARRWRQVKRLQAELAFQKWRVARAGKPLDDDPIIVALRADIVTRRPTGSVDIKRMLQGIVETGDRP